MKLVGLMPVRNEDWILGCSLRVALKWCDEVVIFNHASTEHSHEIALDVDKEHYGRITFMGTACEQWDEMGHRQAMLQIARTQGATHIAIIDADEVLTSNLYDQVRQWCETLPAGAMLTLPGYNLRGGLHQYHSNGVWGCRWFSTVFKDSPELSWRGDCFHHREPFGRDQWRYFKPVQQGAGGVLHFWGANERRLRAKHALYKLTERIRWPHKSPAEIEGMYNLAIYPEASAGRWATDWKYMATPASWLPVPELLEHIKLDAEPWQEAECRRLVAEHGRDTLVGLDLFGVV